MPTNRKRYPRTAKAIRTGMLLVRSLAQRMAGSRGSALRPNILMYHRVVDADAQDTAPEPGTWVGVETFEKQIRYLVQTCHVVPLDWLVYALRESGGIPERTCAVTFDDGWLDNYTNALPILERYEVPATIFLATHCLGGRRRPWAAVLWDALMALTRDQLSAVMLPEWVPDDLVHAVSILPRCGGSRRCGQAATCMRMVKELPSARQEWLTEHLSALVADRMTARQMLNWAEVQTMRDSGIHFGAHTREHRILTGLSDDCLVGELTGSKMDIEDALGERVAAFAYPNGDWDERTRRAVSDAGFDYACTTSESSCSEGCDLLALPRRGVHEGISEGFLQFSTLAFALRLRMA